MKDEEDSADDDGSKSAMLLKQLYRGKKPKVKDDSFEAPDCEYGSEDELQPKDSSSNTAVTGLKLTLHSNINNNADDDAMIDKIAESVVRD